MATAGVVSIRMPGQEKARDVKSSLATARIEEIMDSALRLEGVGGCELCGVVC